MKAPITREFNEYPGMVYFVQGENSGFIKIGHTRCNVFSRMEQIAGMCGEPIYIIGCMYGSRKDERALHRFLKDHRAHGEWFKPESPVIECLSDILKDKPRLNTQ